MRGNAVAVRRAPTATPSTTPPKMPMSSTRASHERQLARVSARSRAPSAPTPSPSRYGRPAPIGPPCFSPGEPPPLRRSRALGVLLGVVLLHLAHDRRGDGTDELGPVGRRPVARAHQRRRGALEQGRHLT